tara:strand:- start:769 stop:1119 length:351 start_codon:yes stop_codon:yes gene_type:complete
MIKQYIPMTDDERMWTIEDIGDGRGYGLYIDRQLDNGSIVGNLYWHNGQIAYIITELAQYVNHSNHPNCRAHTHHDSLFLRTLKPVEKGTELTVDYGDYLLLYGIRNIEPPNPIWD